MCIRMKSRLTQKSTKQKLKTHTQDTKLEKYYKTT